MSGSISLLIKRRLKTITLFLIFIAPAASYAENYNNSANDSPIASKRIEVYALSQNYWDTQYGDTLGDIVHHLLPNNPGKREALQQDIMHLNPTAFINGNADGLLANKRLWLPSYMKQADSVVNPATTTVEHYSWGNIKRPR